MTRPCCGVYSSGVLHRLGLGSCPIVGGHTVEGELGLGFAVTGYLRGGEPLFRKSGGGGGSIGAGVRVGDALLITKPLGVGVIQAAVMRNACPGQTFKEAQKWMVEPNVHAVNAVRSML